MYIVSYVLVHSIVVLCSNIQMASSTTAVTKW